MYLDQPLHYALTGVLFMFLVPQVSGSAIETYRITGVVLNQETNEPVPLVEVFISGSTYGSITDETGKFELETGYLPCQLVASHISYVPYNQTIKADSLVFEASAYQPVIIDNPKLGYRIKIILEEFKLIYDPESIKKVRRGNRIKPDVSGAVYQTLCHFHFSPYPPGKRREQKRREKARLRIYYGSKMHFLRALYTGQLKTNGYRVDADFNQISVSGSREFTPMSGIKFVFLDPEGFPDRVLFTPEKSIPISYFEDHSGFPVDLTWDSGQNLIPQQSEITFGSKEALVRYNGTTFDYSLIFSGHIGGQRISSMVPDDFMLSH